MHQGNILAILLEPTLPAVLGELLLLVAGALVGVLAIVRAHGFFGKTAEPRS